MVSRARVTRPRNLPSIGRSVHSALPLGQPGAEPRHPCEPLTAFRRVRTWLGAKGSCCERVCCGCGVFCLGTLYQDRAAVKGITCPEPPILDHMCDGGRVMVKTRVDCGLTKDHQRRVPRAPPNQADLAGSIPPPTTIHSDRNRRWRRSCSDLHSAPYLQSCNRRLASEEESARLRPLPLSIRGAASASVSAPRQRATVERTSGHVVALERTAVADFSPMIGAETAERRLPDFTAMRPPRAIPPALRELHSLPMAFRST